MLIISVSSGCSIRGNIIEQEDTGNDDTVENTDAGIEDANGEEEESSGDLLLKLQEKQDEFSGGAALGGSYPEVDGLHVTGTPVKVSISQYRLEVKGAVDNPLSLTFDQVKDMESVRKFMTLVCPGFFTDEGVNEIAYHCVESGEDYFLTDEHEWIKDYINPNWINPWANEPD